MILDGIWATVFSLGFDEQTIRGEQHFADHHKDVKNFVDLISLTHPDTLTDIHRQFLAAGVMLWKQIHLARHRLECANSISSIWFMISI